MGLSSNASRSDLEFYYDMKMYLNIDNEIATACLNSIRRHLWYLMPEHVFLSFFDPMITIDEKQVLAVTLLSYNCPELDEFQPGKPDFKTPLLALKCDDALNCENRAYMPYFITKDTWFLFSYWSKYLERNNNTTCLFA